MTHYVFLDIVVQGHRERRKLNVTTLSDHDVFLGFDWLEYHNPEIDWAKRTLRFTRCNCGELKLEDGDKVLALDSDYIRKQFSEYERIRATKATDLAIAQGKSTKAKSMQEVVPEEYWYGRVDGTPKDLDVALVGISRQYELAFGDDGKGIE